MSAERSSSAVRNLRSIFENKATESSPDTRGRSSSGGLTDKTGSRQTSRIRASFVPVEPVVAMAEDATGKDIPTVQVDREDGAGLKMDTQNESAGEGTMQDMGKMVSQEAEKSENDTKVAETIPENVAEAGTKDRNGDVVLEDKKKDGAVEDSTQPVPSVQEPPHPDEPTTIAEDEPVTMQTSVTTDEDAVTGGQALLPAVENTKPEAADENAIGSEKISSEQKDESATAVDDHRENVKPETPSGKVVAKTKPAPVSTASRAKVASSLKSPAAQPKPPSSSKPPAASQKASTTKEPVRKASRSSLTAPTAASVARTAAADRAAPSSTTQPPSSKHKPRESTKPIDLPSRLTAPTAASKAKHDPSPTSSSFPSKPATTTRSKPAATSARPTPRSSLGPVPRPDSRTSVASKKPAAAPEGSFLERMMRPTAASASKVHEKVETKSPPRPGKAASAGKPKPNGHSVKAATNAKSTEAGHALPEAHMDGGLAGEAPHDGVDRVEAQSEPVDTADAGAGHETPLAQTNGDKEPAQTATLEATPGFAGEDTIR